MFTANITVTYYSYHMHLVGNNSSMQPIPIWFVGKFTFLHNLYV